MSQARSTRAPSARSEATREAILGAAERLYAENGVVAVSNRQVGDAAGQSNSAVVGYHFGSKEDLVRAIVVRRTGGVERIRSGHVAAIGEGADLRAWVSALVLPSTQYFAELGAPTWYARFASQVMTDPVLRPILVDEALSSATLRETLTGITSCLPPIPADVRSARGAMARTLLTHVMAEREAEFAASGADPTPYWTACGIDLVDAIVGIWSAPVSR
ncbi:MULTISPECIES: TetR/AcrR family transcriptional regulator [Nocardiaceae]|uniref:AcrR family transcriptional regulator n=1 Tax=Rhodococcoides corynebacterioides TaxID=53972 RepID=A0ABS2KPJ7_9NOCA|nr:MULTISPECIES: TetR family transcriptional regulator [Rhodococcus]MBM7413888.1 AcrR family transcriptional regulator [Rhodococcus corynebacterioides]MBP1116351.1 AcrR family transcriptional regulator [Rhodococcus sp. PvP016]